MRRTRVSIPFFLAFLGAIVLATHLPVLVSRVLTNYGMLLLSLEGEKVSYGVASPSLEQVRSLLVQAGKWNPSNLTVQRGLAFIHWQSGEDEKALQEWEAVGYTADDYITFARHTPQHLVEMRLRWYRLIEQVDPDSELLWLDVGLFCQQEMPLEEICTRFVAHNEQSWLIDPDFRFNRSGWRFNRREGAAHDMVKCPGLPQHKCAVVTIKDTVPEHGASWHQCLYVEPGAQYRFSAWLKVEMRDNGRWYPVYFQGDINGTPKGFWGSLEREATDWSYWEQTFVASTFDQDRACFHPVRLDGKGSAWFYAARLEIVGQ